MQVILTEEEYNTLKAQATLGQAYSQLHSQYLELKANYNKLLVFGVTISNEKLKATYEHR